MTLSLHSHYTPSMMGGEELEQLFVKREAIAAEAIGNILSSVKTGSKRHTLIIGPRGSGKTHLISLIYHRVVSRRDLLKRLRIARLAEDEWGVTSFLDLALRILRALLHAHPDEGLAARIETLREYPRAQAEHEAASLLARYAAQHSVLILVENLEDLFHGIGDDGQRRFRAFLQEYPRFILVGTSQRLFVGVSRQKAPFFGFFSVIHLEPFSVGDAVELLVRLARRRNDDELATFLTTPLGRARLRAVHHLAGGTPRIYVIFSYFITRTSLDELVPAFMRTLDDLTPYYQARMAWLPAQQRKIVEFLATRPGAVTVKEIASSLFISQQVAASQLKQLREAHYVMSESVGRESYYDLAEPLMGLTLNLKRSRGEAAQPFIEFLRCWYTPEEIEESIAALQPGRGSAGMDPTHLKHVLESYKEGKTDPSFEAFFKDYDLHIHRGEFNEAIAVSEELIALGENFLGWMLKGDSLRYSEREHDALQAYEAALVIEPEDEWALLRCGVALYHLDRKREALAYIDRSLAVNSGDRSLAVNSDEAEAWNYRGWCLLDTGDPERAKESFEKALALSTADEWAFIGLADAHMDLAQPTDALRVLNRGLLKHKESIPVLEAKARVLALIPKPKELLGVIASLILLDPTEAIRWEDKAAVLKFLNRSQEALEAIDYSVEQSGAGASTWALRGQILVSLGRHSEAREAFQHAVSLDPTCGDALLELAIDLLRRCEWEPGLRQLNTALGVITSTDQVVHSVGSAIGAMFIDDGIEDEAGVLMKERIDKLVAIFRSHSAMPLLVQGWLKFAQYFTVLRRGSSIDLNLEDLTHLFGEHEEFRIPLRLFAEAMRYNETNDRRVLLALPVEERTIVEQLVAETDNGKHRRTGSRKDPSH